MTVSAFLTPFLDLLNITVSATLDDEVALIECVDRRTGKPIAVLCKVEEDLGTIGPLAILCSKEDLASIIFPDDDTN